MAGFWPVGDVLGYLAGCWQVRRDVWDVAGGTGGEFRGRAEFTRRDDGGLLYREDGTFVWQGVGRAAGRTMLFLPGARPGTADVRFADGRAFHDLDLSTGHHAAEHLCSADLYRGGFSAFGAGRWRSVWRVGGPAKDLLLTTEYVRERAAPGGQTGEG